MTNEEKQPIRGSGKPPGIPARKGRHAARASRRGKRSRPVGITLKILRILLVPLLCIAALIAGLIVGYVYIGGQEMSDVWDIGTWKHVFDLMFAPG